MNKEKVINYVMSTPGNTNPSVLNTLLDENSSGGDGSPLGSIIIFNTTDKNISVAGVVKTDDGVIQSRSVTVESRERGEVFMIPANGSTRESVAYVSDCLQIQMNQVATIENTALVGENAIITKIGNSGSSKVVYDVYAPVGTVLTFSVTTSM